MIRRGGLWPINRRLVLEACERPPRALTADEARARDALRHAAWDAAKALADARQAGAPEHTQRAAFEVALAAIRRFDDALTAPGTREYELMWIEQRPYVARLNELIGAPAIVYLCGLLYEDGLTPTEARPWLEPPERDWDKVESLLFKIYVRRSPHDRPLPWHIIRWVEQYRKRRVISLFDD